MYGRFTYRLERDVPNPCFVGDDAEGWENVRALKAGTTFELTVVPVGSGVARIESLERVARFVDPPATIVDGAYRPSNSDVDWNSDTSFLSAVIESAKVVASA